MWGHAWHVLISVSVATDWLSHWTEGLFAQLGITFKLCCAKNRSILDIHALKIEWG